MFEKCGLPGAACAGKEHEFALINKYRDVGQRLKRSAVELGNMRELDHAGPFFLQKKMHALGPGRKPSEGKIVPDAQDFEESARNEIADHANRKNLLRVMFKALGEQFGVIPASPKTITRILGAG